MQVDVFFAKVLSRIDSAKHFEIEDAMQGHLQIVSVLHIVTWLIWLCANPELQDGKTETYTEQVKVITHSASASGTIPSEDWASIVYRAVPKYWNCIEF
jgi:hypothetical protein